MRTSRTLLAILISGTLLAGMACRSSGPSSSPGAGSTPPPQAPLASPEKAGAPLSQNAPATTAQAAATPLPEAEASPLPPQPAPAPPPLPPPPPPKPIVIPSGTVLQVRITQALGSKLSQVGERFDASLAAPVTVGNKVVIPMGTRARGTVTEAHPAGRFKGGATLGITLNSLVIDGRVHSIQTAVFDEASKGKGKRTAGMIGGGTGAGALIGGLAGGGKGALIGGLVGAGAGTVGAATGNRDITLASETPVSFQMLGSLKLTP